MPGPPPYGRSSTLRCRSVAKSRGFTVPSDHNPRSSARPVTPYRATASTNSGNSVTTSICIALAASIPRSPASIIRWPVDHDATRAQVNRIDIRRHQRNQPLTRTARFAGHAQDGMRAGFDESRHPAERGILPIDDAQAHEIGEVYLACPRRRQRVPRHGDARATPRRCILTDSEPLEERNDRIAVLMASLEHGKLAPPLLFSEPPAGIRQQRRRRRSERPRFE